MKKDILTSLQNIGLSEKEAAAYAALLDMKKGSAMTVAEAAGIKRPTAYQVLESLRAKKLVAVTTFRNVKDYRALPLENLKHFVRAQKQSVQKELPTMQTLYNNRLHKARLRVYHGARAIKVLLEKSLREKASLYILGEKDRFERCLGDYWKFYQKRSGQLGIKAEFKRYAGDVALMIWKDKVAFLELAEEGQVCAFKNKELHDMYLELWKNY